MELHRQQCQACGSRVLHNLLRHGEGHEATVYVVCANCGALVARYGLATYYHEGKGMDSWLRHAGSEPESARTISVRFATERDRARKEFEEVMEALRDSGRTPK